MAKIQVHSKNVEYSEKVIQAEYDYQTTDVKREGNLLQVIKHSIDNIL